jgi:hypothetical protein
MLMSQIVNDVHWLIYLLSVLAFCLLLTRWRTYGAAWIALLFFIQILFRGCPVTDIYNYFRIQEGLSPEASGLLTAQLSATFPVQMALSALIFVFALAIIVLDTLYT